MDWKKQTGIRIATLFFVVICSGFGCTVKTEPEKVWDLRGKILLLSRSLIGIPYRYGGDEITGFDCSGFVFYVYDCFGVNIPRTAAKQGKMRARVSLKNARPGDILVFRLRKSWHSAIYSGNGIMIHAPSQGGNVRREKLTSFWLTRLKSIISILDNY